MPYFRNKTWVRNLSHWYFSKRVLPYWCILLADAVIVFLACIFTYWAYNRLGVTLEHWEDVLYTSGMCAVLSFVGARIFRT